jgi:hypothetical protein
MPPILLAVTREEVQHFLSEYGYTSNPKGLVSPFPVDYISGPGGIVYFDINADAVRRGDEVPLRPVRITLHIVFDGKISRWKLKSVEELAADMPSKALDRHQDTPSISPWPHSPTSEQ